MSKVLFNRCTVNLQYEAIDRDFDLLSIKCDLPYKSNYGKIVQTIYKQFNPMSLCSLSSNTYMVLLRKGQLINFHDEHYAFKQVAANGVSKLHMSRLLVGALPRLTDNINQSCEKMGLYYLADVEEHAGVKVLRTFQIELDRDPYHYNAVLLNIKGATFTPVSYYCNGHPASKKFEVLPRFTFDELAQTVTKDIRGEYIRRQHRTKRMVSQMISLDTKNPSEFGKSKMGILSVFDHDMKTYLKNYIQLEFNYLSSDYRQYFVENDVAKAYQTIENLLKTKLINIVNLTSDNIDALTLAFQKDGYEVMISSETNADSINVVMHYSPEYYQAKDINDPYLALHQKNHLIQSMTIENMFNKKKLNESAYEACKKEIFIKWEVLNQQLQLIVPEGRWAFIKKEEKKANEQDFVETFFHVLTSDQGELSYQCMTEADAMETLLFDMPKLSKNQNHIVIDNNGRNYIIEEISYVALPEYQVIAQTMEELQRGYDEGIRREWVEEFLELIKKGKVKTTNNVDLRRRLENLLSNESSEIITKNILFNKEHRFEFKGASKEFLQWIFLEKKVRLGASLRSKENGLMDAVLGLFYNESEGLYYVGEINGMKASLPRFCNIRKIHTNAEQVSHELLKMMEVFHIRHKQATVYPFMFKHLKEFQKKCEHGYIKSK